MTYNVYIVANGHDEDSNILDFEKNWYSIKDINYNGLKLSSEEFLSEDCDKYKINGQGQFCKKLSLENNFFNKEFSQLISHRFKSLMTLRMLNIMVVKTNEKGYAIAGQALNYGNCNDIKTIELAYNIFAEALNNEPVRKIYSTEKSCSGLSM